MPRNDSGIYSLPPGSDAVTGTTIQATTHNTPLADIAQALTDSLPRNGSAPMTAPLRMVNGSVGAPALSFNSSTNTGLILTANGIGFVVNGVQVIEVGAGGFTSGVPVGSGTDFWGTTAPPGWIFPYGQDVSRTTYSALWDAMGSPNTGNGTTTFTLPDKRGRASFSKDDMGGTSANRITNQAGGWNGDVMGDAGGAETHTLTTAQLPLITPTGQANSASSLNGQTSVIKAFGVQLGVGATAYGVGAGSDVTIPVSVSDPNRSLTINPFGSGQAHNTLPPGITCNYIIFAGV